ncbi:DUF6266 family protein [Butyricimonas sp. Marseille-P3923]|uniref:DUF6266 family protein n=1 Tax=Butyricimonas sp. Marseille-P3923 TaxID=1987504 RepID=UPI000C06FCDF|nr:DUF6266 family protein [Butyricimonas sp. Marseille-P3923]
MAEFNSYLLGKAKKSVGNITLCYTRRKNIAKAKIFSRKDNPTPEMLAQRARMKVLVQLSRNLLPVIRKGFVGIGNGSTSNAFVARNMKAVEVNEQNVATVNFDQLLVASGILNPPKVTVTYDEENNKYQFSQVEQAEEDGYAFVDDQVYAVLYETERGRSRLVELRTRGESGSTSYALPEEWDNTKVKVYCFAMLKRGKEVSDSKLIA